MAAKGKGFWISLLPSNGHPYFWHPLGMALYFMGMAVEILNLFKTLFRLYAVLIIWLSTMNMNGCYPIVASVRNNPLYMNCQLLGRSDCLLLLLLNGCLAKMDGSEELALFKSLLEKSDIKRSFRNGVGSGIKKTSFRRAKS